MATQLYVDAERAKTILRDLSQYKLVDIERDDDMHYSYHSEWDADDCLMAAAAGI